MIRTIDGILGKALVVWVACLLPLSGKSQTRLPTFPGDSIPDFGTTAGDWASLRWDRPYGLQGIISDGQIRLLEIDPVTGDRDFLLRPWWGPEALVSRRFPLDDPLYYDRADSTYPTLLVTARQGLQEFKALQLWLHQRLTDHLAFGWSSETRSQFRYALGNYDQQIHHLHLLYSYPTWELVTRLDISKLTLPLFLFRPDSLGGQQLDLDSQVAHELTGGRVAIHPRQGWTGIREISLGHRNGWRDWEGVVRPAWSLETRAEGRISVREGSTLSWMVDWTAEELDSLKRNTSLVQFTLPEFSRGKLDGLVKILGVNGRWLPVGTLSRTGVKATVSLQRKALLHSEKTLGNYTPVAVNILQTGVINGTLQPQLEIWQGGQGEGRSSGYRVGIATHPWPAGMFRIHYQRLTTIPVDFVWDRDRITWQFQTPFTLFRGRMTVDLDAWGSHHRGLERGILRDQDLRLTPSGFQRGTAWLHRLNYAVQVRVRTVTLAFTDVNMLQDAFWKQVFGSAYATSYEPILNLPDEIRFQYFTLTWEFTN